MSVTSPSTCSWLDHPVSGLVRRTERPVQTRFRCAYAYRLKLARHTKSLTHYTKGTPSPAHQMPRHSAVDTLGRSSEFLGAQSPRKQGRPRSEEFGGRAPTVCRYPVSGTVSLPSSGCFSPFPHGTCSLSVAEEYLGLEGGPPMFRQDFTCPALLEDERSSTSYGAVTHDARRSRRFRLNCIRHWPGPRSLATTNGVSLMSFPPGT